MNRRHDSYEDYVKEVNEDEELKKHLADECDENTCGYCADERNDAEYDEIEELVDHVNDELDKEEKK